MKKETKPEQKSEPTTYEEYIQSLEPDEENKIKEIFELFDKNIDGGVDMKELEFILNSLEIRPNHEELAAMMAEADLKNKGYINEQDFKYIIAKQKIDYKKKLIQEARGNPELEGTISTSKIQKILRDEFELSEELEITLKKIAQNKEDITFDDFMKFFQ